MSFTITHVTGAMETDPPLSALNDLIPELDAADSEHVDVAVADAAGWTLSAYASGRLVWENVEAGEPRYLLGAARPTVVGLMRALAQGDRGAVEEQPRLPRYG